MHPFLHAFLAQTADGAQQPSALISFLPFIAIAVVFYFVFFRPQAKQAKQHQAFVAGLKKGEEIVTQSGIIGTVSLVEDRTVTLDLGGGTKIRIVKAQVAGAWQEKPAAAQPAKAEGKK